MDQADEELRETINMIWPFQAKKMLDLLIPRNDRLNKNNLTVGKVYAGLLILESWRNTRFGQTESGIPVSSISSISNQNFSRLRLLRREKESDFFHFILLYR